MKRLSEKEKEKRRLIAFRMGLVIICLVVVFVFARSYYYKSKQDDLDIKSRYTFSVDIDAYGNELSEQYQTTAVTYDDSSVVSTVPDVYEVETKKIAKTWINAYVRQYMNEYLPANKAVRKVSIDNIETLNEDEHIALISFSVILKNPSTDCFISWDGITDNGRLKCEWVIGYYLDAHSDNTASVYVASVMSPEEYGIAQYNEKAGVTASKEDTSNTSAERLTKYIIRDNILSVTYDGGQHYTTVPVDIENLLFEANSTSTLKDGSYMITTSKTAFIYGGKTGAADKVPVTICYSNDKGANWTTCELDSIYNAEDYYVHFFDENKGVVVCGYAMTDNEKESYKIYKTDNGGESWTTVGSGPANYLLKGIAYVDENVGFFCFNYMDGMDGNLYITKDGGKTFSKVNLPEQELDSTAKSEMGSSSQQSEELKWSNVYKEALVPVVDENGVITIYLTQGSDGTYNDGKTAAKYQSSDKGENWNYISQLEITQNSTTKTTTAKTGN